MAKLELAVLTFLGYVWMLILMPKPAKPKPKRVPEVEFAWDSEHNSWSWKGET